MIRNERGLTLLELLAVTVIVSIVLGIAFVLLHSLFQTWDDAHQTQTSQTEVSQTLHRLSQELSAAVAVYLPDDNELRFESADGAGEYKAFVFEDDTLTLYLFTGDAIDFTDPDVTFAAEPALYAAPRELSERLAAAPVYRDEQEQSFRQLDDGAFFTIQLTFMLPSGPANAVREEEHELAIKLLEDGGR